MGRFIFADIGRVAAAVIENPKAHINKTYEISGGQQLTMEKISSLFGSVLGRDITHQPVPAREFAATAMLPPAIAQLFDFFADEPSGIPFSHSVEEITGVPAVTLAQWIESNKDKFQVE